jgi:hypothetical protein
VVVVGRCYSEQPTWKKWSLLELEEDDVVFLPFSYRFSNLSRGSPRKQRLRGYNRMHSDYKNSFVWGDDLESGTHKFLITREQTKQYLVYCSKFGTSSRIVAEVFSLQLAVLNL